MPSPILQELDMNKTLEENGVPDEDSKFEDLQVSPFGIEDTTVDL